jgi:hypothetical protein
MDAEAGLIPFCWHSADKLRHGFNADTFVARAAKYSVSHFIDCVSVARRLCASPIASRNTADEMRKIKKHECNQT